MSGLHKASCLPKFPCFVQGVPCSHCRLTSGWHTSQAALAAVREQLCDFPAAFPAEATARAPSPSPVKGMREQRKFYSAYLGCCHHPVYPTVQTSGVLSLFSLYRDQFHSFIPSDTPPYQFFPQYAFSALTVTKSSHLHFHKTSYLFPLLHASLS